MEGINKRLKEIGSGIQYFYGKPIQVFNHICNSYDINEVYTNQDYEPYAISRDSEIEKFLNEKGIIFKRFKDQVIFEKNEILKADGKPYTIYSPYAKVWHEKYSAEPQTNLKKI